MSTIRTEAMRALGKYLITEVPELLGKVYCGQVESDQETVERALYMVPSLFRFEPLQDSEIEATPQELTADRELHLVGRMVGQVRLWLAARNLAERETIEERVLHALIGQEELAPGVTVVQTDRVDIGGVQTLYPATCVFELEDGAWLEEASFARRRLSQLTLSCNYNALVLRRTRHVWSQLVLALETDLGKSAVANGPVLINADGSVSTYTGP